jgi:uncharacterized membrane protein YfcA
MSLWVWALAPVIGLLLGLFGAGGGMLTVPLLIYGVGLPLKQAIASSLWIVAGVSVVAAFHQRAWRVIQPMLLVFFSIGGILGGIGGAWLGTWINPMIQQALFGCLLLIVAIWTWRIRLHEEPPPAATCHCLAALITGIGLGVLTGLLGVGGGFLMVPALIMLGISHLPTAVAHSLVLITINATASGFTYLGKVPSSPETMLLVGTLAAVGSIIGSTLLKRIPLAPLQRAFSIGLALLGITMLLQLKYSF